MLQAILVAALLIDVPGIPEPGSGFCDDDGTVCVLRYVDAIDMVVKRQVFITTIEARDEEIGTLLLKLDKARTAYAEVFAGKCTAKLEVIEPSKDGKTK